MTETATQQEPDFYTVLLAWYRAKKQREAKQAQIPEVKVTKV